MTRGRPVAILDLDRTLIDVDAGLAFARHIVRADRTRIRESRGAPRRALARRHRLRIFEVYAKAVVLVPLYRARIVRRSRLVRASYAFFRGYDLEAVRDALAAFFEAELRHRVYPGVAALLGWHAERGHDSAILTSAPRSVAESFARHLGIAHAEGVSLEQEDGRLTGRIRDGPLWGADKLRCAHRLAEENQWDLAASYAYSDHDSDVALLEAVGHAVPVHPNRRLARIARQRAWPVLDLAEETRVVRALASRA